MMIIQKSILGNCSVLKKGIRQIFCIRVKYPHTCHLKKYCSSSTKQRTPMFYKCYVHKFIETLIIQNDNREITYLLIDKEKPVLLL